MKKKIVATCATVALAAVALGGATLAYFTDAEQKTNTMAIGDVEINIEELMKNPDWTEGSSEDMYIEFDESELTLFPIDDAQGQYLFNKMVYTFNTSDSKYDAYIRTIALVECHTYEKCDNDCCLDGIHFGYSATDYSLYGKKFHGADNQDRGVITVNNQRYHVVVFWDIDKEAIPYGEALSAINGVWLDKNMTADDAAKWGENLDVIVLSQGIQSTGLTHDQAMEQLGEVTYQNLEKWLREAGVAEINDVFNVTVAEDDSETGETI